jgi:glyoxylase-like metal-dependent hydrolase (beta-lactamase superfamily II)
MVGLGTFGVQARSMKSITIVAIASCVAFASSAQEPLAKCYEKLVKPTEGRALRLTFDEHAHRLYHTLYPWHQTNYQIRGTVWTGSGSFTKTDTTLRIGSTKPSLEHISLKEGALLFARGPEKKLQPVTEADLNETIMETARYSPIFLIDLYKTRKITPRATRQDTVLYTTAISSVQVTLHIGKRDGLLHRISMLSYDELHGDVTTTYWYDRHSSRDGITAPGRVIVEKINGRVMDTIQVNSCELVKAFPSILEKPADYKLESSPSTTAAISRWDYNERIHFFDLKHVGEQVMAAEFDNYFVVAEAPLSSANGELILSELRKINPSKPVRYFAFGHYHPHYTGGMRPFVHRGATVICCPGDTAYVKYLSTRPHSLRPDSLQLHPRPVTTRLNSDSMVITDGKMRMEIHFIGEASGHTNDYMIFYFPAEKLLYEGDLVWIPKTGEIPKAGKTQAGLYEAIKSRSLKVDTIIQSWMTGRSTYKTTIPFEELERSVSVK